MPLQNRVTPFGEIVATEARGTLMGNRGILHDAQRRLGVSRWKTQAWILCLLQFKDRHRAVMTPGTWTELFFLDEATGLAAGHRPCGECRRTAFHAFARAWLGDDASADGRRAAAPEIDRRLHAERVRRDRSKVLFDAEAELLPDGTMIVPPNSTDPWLIWQREVHRWTHQGYAGRRDLPRGPVTVLTPRSTVSALARGYLPAVHASVHEPLTAPAVRD